MSRNRPSQDQGGGVLPARSPARFGCYLGLLVAVVVLAYGAWMLLSATEDPLPYKLAALIVGLLQGVLCVHALRLRRVAWAFALSLNGTLGVVFLFGAPKVRDSMDLPLLASLIPAVVFAVITALLAAGTDDYGS